MLFLLQLGNVIRRGFALGYLHKEILGTKRRQLFAEGCIARAKVLAVAGKQSRLHCVRQICSENLIAQARAELRILYREDHFAALEEIAWHPVGAAAIEFLRAAICEVKDAAMFEESPHNRAHADILAHALQARSYRADAA